MGTKSPYRNSWPSENLVLHIHVQIPSQEGEQLYFYAEILEASSKGNICVGADPFFSCHGVGVEAWSDTLSCIGSLYLDDKIQAFKKSLEIWLLSCRADPQCPRSFKIYCQIRNEGSNQDLRLVKLRFDTDTGELPAPFTLVSAGQTHAEIRRLSNLPRGVQITINSPVTQLMKNQAKYSNPSD